MKFQWRNSLKCVLLLFLLFFPFSKLLSCRPSSKVPKKIRFSSFKYELWLFGWCHTCTGASRWDIGIQMVKMRLKTSINIWDVYGKCRTRRVCGLWNASWRVWQKTVRLHMLPTHGWTEGGNFELSYSVFKGVVVLDVRFNFSPVSHK